MHQLLTDTTLYIDKSRMAQVIRNLMSNALKFTPSGGVVRITAERITDSIVSKDGVSLSGPQELLRLRVIDSGAGIAPVCEPYPIAIMEYGVICILIDELTD